MFHIIFFKITFPKSVFFFYFKQYSYFALTGDISGNTSKHSLLINLSWRNGRTLEVSLFVFNIFFVKSKTLTRHSSVLQNGHCAFAGHIGIKTGKERWQVKITSARKGANKSFLHDYCLLQLKIYIIDGNRCWKKMSG